MFSFKQSYVIIKKTNLRCDKMGIEITTPAIAFSAISLLMAAYMVRFSRIYRILVDLSEELREEKNPGKIIKQIDLLSKRMTYIKAMLLGGIFSLLASTVSIFLIFWGHLSLARIAFALAIIFFLICLIFVLIELYYSNSALDKLKK